MSTLLRHVEHSILSRGLLAPGEPVLIAVSGGIDSMVLLHLLSHLSRKHSWKIVVAHVNHRLRGRSSDADERLVRAAARRLGFQCVVGRRDVKRFARRRKVSIEMAARTVRHEFLARTARHAGIRRVVLAHHAGDQAELFLLRLLRGSGEDGLAGMRWNAASPADPEIRLIRPLLDQARSSLEHYAVKHRVRFREDATNYSLEFLRNRVRHELLPLLRENYQPAIDEVIGRVMEISARNADCIGRIAEDWLRKGGVAFQELHDAVQRKCLQLELMRLRIPADFELIERLRTCANRKFSAGDVFVVRDDSGRLSVANAPEERKGQGRVELELELNSGSGTVRFEEVDFTWGTRRNSGEPRRFLPGQELFDAEKVGERVVLRHWVPGDRFQPIGMSRTVKLQDLFTNLKIPRDRRGQLVVAVAENGELFWVEGLRISERFKVTRQTIRRLLWRWKRP